ncbi:MAG: MFS transporter [Methanomassiliicoccaceae archaeon]|jgi:MFS family permease|nr:MFS transporter [Euryarchaeota archaeon]HOB38224.1 MFS transporter [Methanomassiliicoccaceae archaeon]HQA20939.1 MFS transporter [Methanomassiliicoccaceae archaeon]HQD88041.1 MFS transporter [Methanomassiliicoccaceae archaeon]
MGRRQDEEKWYFSFLPYNMAGGSTSPLIPLFVTEVLNGPLTQVGLVSAFSSLAAVPSNIIWGNLSDTVKKRRVFILIGFGGLALALFMMGVATSMNGYLFANLMMGALASAAAPVGTVLILESFKYSEWAQRLGDFSRVGGIGWVAGLILGTVWLSSLESGQGEPAMRALFMLGAALSLVSMFLAYKWVPEPHFKLDRRIVDGHLLDIPLMIAEKARYLPHRVIHVLQITSRNIRAENFTADLRKYYACTFIIFTGSHTFFVAFPVFLKQYVGLLSWEVFLIYVAASLASAMTYSAAGRWAAAIGSKRIYAASVAVRVLLFPLAFFVTTLSLGRWEIVAVFCLLHGMMGFFWANISVAGNHLVAKISRPEFRAESTGMYSSMQGMAIVTGAIIGGFVGQFMGYQVLFLLSSLLMVAGLLLLSRVEVGKEPSEDGSLESV